MQQTDGEKALSRFELTSNQNGSTNIPFTKPTRLGTELDYISCLVEKNSLFEAKQYVNDFFLNSVPNAIGSFFCTSCTAALELAALSIGIKAGDEVIVPDYTFVTSASAFALRGAQMVYCDVNPRDLCIDTNQVVKSITKKTKAIVWVDYAGNSNRAIEIREICDKYGIVMIQDSAQSVGFSEIARSETNIVGDFITFSFHSTKNVTSGGEGGVLLVCDDRFISKVEIIYDKGTNRREFIRGNVDKYTWRLLGSSYEGADLVAAWLTPQLKDLSVITETRRKIWQEYHRTANKLIDKGWLLPNYSNMSNAHIYWLIPPTLELRERSSQLFIKNGIEVTGHYQSLYESPFGKSIGSKNFELKTSIKASEMLIRLPLWHGMDKSTVQSVIMVLHNLFELN